ncbi:M43 family zinc metalloprotease [Flavihumibacter petaseus]|uniref:Peptidase M43 pregnancy-associated plasma-A domain-containing protein n=1 Tax=Flavihumibacter petaseus NBRC 106054 TaxID=1220578 RepID=A0A0E9N250_9BACT|nr:M43 family zinc metalloprotease [Flavihumibacter petaseus]GAO44107.1 hypothetical protein FPE01S_03_01460 [Flavihumibacter petaseus NBRC 106054]
MAKNQFDTNIMDANMKKVSQLLLILSASILATANISYSQTIRIPIIVHVIYTDRAHQAENDRENTIENISRQTILNELKDLHDDFLLLNADTSGVLPIYKPKIANPDIEFYLADTIIQEGGEPGIKRINKNNRSKLYNKSRIINHERYLNIYIGNIPGSFSPSDTPWEFPRKDAVYVEFKWVGHGYRIFTHEVGHWLGLLHPWGTGNATGDAESCSTGDGLRDTPAQKEATELDAKCETCPPPFGNAVDKSCTPGEPSNYNNFMDYSGCRKMFTKDQVTLMRDNINKHRQTLLFTDHFTKVE